MDHFSAFNILEIKDNGADVDFNRGLNVDASILPQLAINEANLRMEIIQLPSTIAFWTRMVARARRVWEILERDYRSWRSQITLQLLEKPADATASWKKPTKDQVDATYRINPTYKLYYMKIEAAEEAYNAAVGILEAFKAKKELLKLSVITVHNENEPRMVI